MQFNGLKMLERNKKAFEGGGFGFVIKIILLLLAAGIILAALKGASKGADEKVKMDVCRISNEIKLGIVEKQTKVLSSPRICSTIYKAGSEEIPTEEYMELLNKRAFQTEAEAAEAEIMDMIKNCWYMWLEGSYPNTFTQMTYESDGCFMCYVFEPKSEIKDLNLFSLPGKMNNKVFFAVDSSDKCTNSGGTWVADQNCELDLGIKFVGLTGVKKDVGATVPGKVRNTAGQKEWCCVDALNECENKGGWCDVSKDVSGDTINKPSEFKEVYTKWNCPAYDQICHVKKENIYSYADYITRYGRLGGDAYVGTTSKDTGIQKGEVDYPSGTEYAISFFSPPKKCAKFSCKILDLFGINPSRSLLVMGLDKIGFDLLAEVYSEKLTPGLKVKPNFILISSLDQAEEFKCATN